MVGSLGAPRSGRYAVASATLVVACSALTACSSSGDGAGGSTDAGSVIDAASFEAATGDGSVASGDGKPRLAGMIDKGSEASYHAGQPYPVTDPSTDSELLSKSPAFGGLVVNQTWLQLEPEEGTFDFDVLDQSLAAVAAYDASDAGAHFGVRLRVFGAYAAPSWAKTLDGPAIDTTDSSTNEPATVGRWWGPNTRAAWAALQAALSERYDGNDVLFDVAVSSCAASTAEPMVIDTDTLQAAEAVGYTTDEEHDCLIGAFADYAGWKRTALYFPMNPIAGDTTVAPDIIDRCATSYATGGPFCILANNALDEGADTSPSRLAPIYSDIDTAYQANGATTSVAFQMNGPTTATWCAAIGVAVNHHAGSVELWPNGYGSLTTSTLLGWSQALGSGTPPACN
jgi:hypothetical protein